jgi:hypothetical protein
MNQASELRYNEKANRSYIKAYNSQEGTIVTYILDSNGKLVSAT